MVYFNRPTVTRTYTEVLTDLDAKIDAATGLLSSDVSAYTNEGGSFPVRAVRWNASSNKFERRNSANNDWESLSTAWAFDSITTGNITSSGTGTTISGVDITASAQLQAARVNVTGSTKPANGLYLAATNEVRFTTNSNDCLTIDADGKVGIANTDPSKALDIVGDVRLNNGTGNSLLDIGGGGTGNRSAAINLVGDATYTTAGFQIIRGTAGENAKTELIHRGTGNLVLEANEAADILFKTTNLTRLIIDSGGAVCIGDDATPDDRLHVKQATDNAVYIRVENNDGHAKFGTDANDSFIDADVQWLRSRDGNTNYLNIASVTAGGETYTLFDIKTNAKVNGNLEVTGTLNASIEGTAETASKLALTAHGGSEGDTTCFPLFSKSATGSGETAQSIHTASTLTFNSSTGALGATSLTVTNLNVTGTFTGTTSNSSALSNKTLSASGDRWGVIPYVDTSGYMEVGQYIDFHTADNSTSDHAGRISCASTSFSFDNHVLPSGDTGTLDLGSSGARWRNLYINDLQLSNKGQTNDVDGTWGDYTIQEGENDLYLLNRRNGKTYKFNLTEVGQIS